MPSEFHYQIPWCAHSRHPGRHPGAQAGAGVEYLGAAPFASQPDARHLDVRAMLADPFGRLLVKSFRQRAAVPVWLLADVSASMAFNGKLARLAEFGEALAWSAWRSGDPFGCFACAGGIAWDISLPLRRHKGVAADWRGRMARFQPDSGRHEGLLDAAWQLGRQRSLVFLLSDFHWPEAQLQALLDALALHDVVPVVLWDQAEYANLPRFGLAELADPETGQRRRVFFRPELREKIAAAYALRRERLTALCSAHGRAPFFLTGAFDAEQMTQYFYPA
ncbi:MAG: DUF58 domain-containing protein [Candidatus Methylumidiphilus sp.]